MSKRAAFTRWSLIGAVAAIILVVAQVVAMDGMPGLLQVGHSSALRPLIERELGPVPLAPGPGHDGQIYYAMALDLDGDVVGPLLDHAGYRYRRILFPAVASLFGLLGGQALLWGMVVVVVGSTALGAGALAVMGVARGGSDWIGLAVILNPGVWLSVRLLTADVVAMALMAVALMAMTERRPSTHPAFALSALAKDFFILTPLALAVERPRRRWRVGAAPLIALGIWSAVVGFLLGEGFSPRGNLALPFAGIVGASSNWTGLEVEDLLYLLFALASVATGLVVGLTRRSWLRLPILAWAALGVVSSNWVWDFGNNAARAFVALPVLITLGFLRGTTGSLEPPAGSLRGSAS